MYLAAQEGQFEILEFLVQKRRGNVKIKAYDGMSCLHAAAQSGHLHCVRFLVSTCMFFVLFPRDAESANARKQIISHFKNLTSYY